MYIYLTSISPINGVRIERHAVLLFASSSCPRDYSFLHRDVPGQTDSDVDGRQDRVYRKRDALRNFIPDEGKTGQPTPLGRIRKTNLSSI